MADREKVINEFEHLLNAAKDNYQDFVDLTVDGGEEILALLKEQKQKPQRYKEYDPFHLPYCPNEDCNAFMEAYWRFCPYCGAPMAWDAELDERERSEK